MPEKRVALLHHIGDIETVSTSHGVGEKRVIATHETVGKPVTQIARTKLQEGEKVEEHNHPTMDEHFFFLSGECKFVVDEMEYICKSDDYLYVPAGCKHQILVTKEIEMITFGIAKNERKIFWHRRSI